MQHALEVTPVRHTNYRKHHEEAMKCFQHASVAAPGDARPLLRLGNALFALHQLPRSQEAFRQALTAISLPDDAALLPKIHVNLGISLEAAGHLQAACQHYRCGLACSPYWSGPSTDMSQDR